MNQWIKACAAAGGLLAGAGIFYHQAVFLPAQERAAADARRLAAVQPEIAQCHHAAQLHHDLHWASACMVLAAQQEDRHAACLREQRLLGRDAGARDHCDALHPALDASSECTLPDTRAAPINAALAEAEDRCRDEGRRLAQRRPRQNIVSW